MSIQSKLAQIKTDKQTLAAKVKAFGLGDGSDSLETATDKIDGITVYSIADSSFEVTEGKSTTFPSGYYVGGTITGLTNNELDAKKYRTQAKSCTPTKTAQVITPDNDNDGTLEDGEFYALSSVTVNPIPPNYADVSDASINNSTTSPLSDSIIKGTTVYARDNNNNAVKVIGSMNYINEVRQTLDTSTTSFPIDRGFHEGGSVNIVLEQQAFTPDRNGKTITPTSGRVLSEVVVAPIPQTYAEVSSTTKDLDGSLSDYIYRDIAVYVQNEYGAAKRVTGTMSDLGAIEGSIDGIQLQGDPVDGSGSIYYEIPKGYHNGLGKVYFDDSTILSLLDEI